MSLDLYWTRYDQTLARIRAERPTTFAGVKLVLDTFESKSSGDASFLVVLTTPLPMRSWTRVGALTSRKGTTSGRESTLPAEQSSTTLRATSTA